MAETVKMSSRDYKHDEKNDRESNPLWLSSAIEGARSSMAGGSNPSSQLAVQTHDLPYQVAKSAQGLVKAEIGKQANKGPIDLGDIAKMLRQTSKELDNNIPTPYVEKAAQQLERASVFLRTADSSEVMRRVEQFGKREPWIFLGGALALGMLGARFMKSSSHGHANGTNRSSKDKPDRSGTGRSSQAYRSKDHQ